MEVTSDGVATVESDVNSEDKGFRWWCSPADAIDFDFSHSGRERVMLLLS